ncbi:unnamed protein product [marine sediment metagenome]|uniref:Uncharacterized protein n=1 Tax=marine sediment metagenome TaxID=412755 RepID=X1FWD1_9ZZZZ
MVILTEETKLKRERFIQQIFDEICDVSKYSTFYSHVFCKIACLGLQGKAKKENLFGNGNWSNPENRNEILEIIRRFLIKYIK